MLVLQLAQRATGDERPVLVRGPERYVGGSQTGEVERVDALRGRHGPREREVSGEERLHVEPVEVAGLDLQGHGGGHVIRCTPQAARFVGLAATRLADPPRMTSQGRFLHGAHVRVVDSFESLLATPFEGQCNALCWERTLPGDFDEVARTLGAGDGVTAIDVADLEALPVSAEGALAVAVLLADLRRLREAGHTPELNCVERYPQDTDDLVPTDVYSFHVDSATVPTDTFLCCYAGPASEGVRCDEARRWVDVPEVRAALLTRFGGDDGAAFEAHLRARHLDLHYAPLPHARPYSFGVGHLWRVAVQYPGCPVPACIHRAPVTAPGAPHRLLLIS